MMSTFGSITPYPAYKTMVGKFTVDYRTNKPWNQEYLDMQKYSICDYVNSYGLQDIWNEIMECKTLLEKLGINMSNKTYEVKYMKRAKTYGYCQCLDWGSFSKYLISINEPYLRVGSPEDIHNTIMHEVIHSVDGCMNHGSKWKAIAAKVNTVYAFTPITRLGSSPEYRKEVLEEKYNWELKCEKCGHTWKYIRRGSSLDGCLAGKRIHNRCGGKQFSLKYIGK